MAYPYPGREELQEADWDEAWAYFHRQEELIMLNDFKAACQGAPGAVVTNLDWLSALLHELRRTDWAGSTEDPQSCWEALFRSEGLLRGLHAAREAAQPSDPGPK